MHPRSLASRSALIVALVLPGAAWAGAWVPEPGHGYAEAQQVLFPGFTRAFGEGEFLGQLATHLYGEIGLVGGRLALVARGTPWVYTALPERELSRGGVGDSAVGLRLGLRGDRTPVAVEAHVVLPTGRGDGVLPTGFGAWGATGALYVGRDFPGPWWGQAGLGGAWREGHGPAARLEIAAGRPVSERWSLDGTVIVYLGLGPGPAVEERVMFRGDERWGTLNLRARYAFTDTWGGYAGLDVGLLSVDAPGGVPLAVGITADW